MYAQALDPECTSHKKAEKQGTDPLFRTVHPDEPGRLADKLDRATQTLTLMGGIYDQSAHVVAFHRAPIDEEADT
jgi:hypothetical protein